jgi:class 3 adenylate cyclase
MLRDQDVHGIAVNIAARVMALCKSGDVIVSRTVKDLAAGSGIVFEVFGTPPLRGIEDDRQLYRVTA